MPDDVNTKREQVAQQCKAVAHMAKALAGLYTDYASVFADTGSDNLVEQVGARTAQQMEVLGDILNGMDAVDEEEDGWLMPVFREAQRLWPATPAPAHD